jgi:hypothetical protein
MLNWMVRGGLVLLALGSGLGWLLTQGPGFGAGATAWRGLMPGGVGLPQWGPDILVSTPATSTTTTRSNVSLVVNPHDPNQVLAAYNSDYSDGTALSAYAWSTDAGRSWTGDRFADRWYGGTLLPYGGLDVAFNPQGTAFYASLGVGDTLNGYFVLTTTIPAPWNTPVPVTVNDYNTYRDEGRLAVDPRTSGPDAGSVYLFTRYYNLSLYGGVQAHISRDGGQTWSGDIPISDAGREDNEGLSAAVAADGTVYVAFGEYPRTTVELYLDRSTDAGRTWGPDQLITGAPISNTGTLDYKGHRYVLIGDANDGAFLINNVPAIAVAPNDPATVYVVWNDGRWDLPYMYGAHSGQHGDIAFTRTTDSGLTWSAPQRLNDDPIANGIDQFQPSIAVDAAGTIGVTWYDRRDDPRHFLYALYYSQSTDGGLTWSANARVADVLSDPMAVVNVKQEGNMGEYSGLVFGPDYVLPGWLDGRGPLGRNIYTDRGTGIGPSPTATVPPSHTPTPAASATPSVTPSATPTIPASPSATASATTSVTPCALTFADVPPGSTFYATIRCLACRGIVGGYPCGGPGEPCPGQYYRPGANVTRGQTAKIIAGAAGFTEPVPSTQQTFEDVPPGSTFALYVERLSTRGIIGGYPCGGSFEPCVGPDNRPYFRPNNNVTRGQLAKITSGAAGWSETPTSQTFEDVPPGQTFYLYVERMAARGIIGGYPCGGPGEPCVGPANRPYFRPNNNATRGQMSKIAALAFFPNCATPRDQR